MLRTVLVRRFSDVTRGWQAERGEAVKVDLGQLASRQILFAMLWFGCTFVCLDVDNVPAS